MEYVPDRSEVDVELIQVDADTRDMLKDQAQGCSFQLHYRQGLHFLQLYDNLSDTSHTGCIVHC